MNLLQVKPYSKVSKEEVMYKSSIYLPNDCLYFKFIYHGKREFIINNEITNHCLSAFSISFVVKI